MPTVKKGKEQFEKTINVAASVEAGKSETARQMGGKNKYAHKKVLVVLGGDELGRQILHYSLDLCKRLEGQLEILHKQGPKKVDITNTAAWKEFTKNGEQIVCTTLGSSESLEEKLTEYGETRRDILCVVLQLHLMDNKPVGKKDEKAWSPDWIMQKLNCPVMVYS